jgi:hypothetical protein
MEMLLKMNMHSKLTGPDPHHAAHISAVQCSAVQCSALAPSWQPGAGAQSWNSAGHNSPPLSADMQLLYQDPVDRGVGGPPRHPRRVSCGAGDTRGSADRVQIGRGGEVSRASVSV